MKSAFLDSTVGRKRVGEPHTEVEIYDTFLGQPARRGKLQLEVKKPRHEGWVISSCCLWEIIDISPEPGGLLALHEPAMGCTMLCDSSAHREDSSQTLCLFGKMATYRTFIHNICNFSTDHQ